MGEEIHAQIDAKGFLEHDMVMGNALVDMYVKCDMLGKAHKVLRKLPRRDVVTWSTLIGGYAHCGYGDAALRCFEQMRKEGISPNEVTYMCVLRACGSEGHLGLGKEIHGEIDDEPSLGKDMVIGTALVDMYAKCGMLDEARDVLAELPGRDVVSWNALLSGYAQMGCTKQVFELLHRIHGEGLTLEPISFLILLTACNHAGLIDEGQAVFDEMCSRFSSIPPSLEHYSCMMDLFCRAGQFGRAECILDQVPENDLPPLLLTMLGACHKWKNVELGRWAFERLVELDVGCAPAFVCMRNIYDAMEMANAQSSSRRNSTLPGSCL
jgi:pentatricopeptide repeat protein